MFLIPFALAGCLSFFANVTARAYDPSLKDKSYLHRDYRLFGWEQRTESLPAASLGHSDAGRV